MPTLFFKGPTNRLHYRGKLYEKGNSYVVSQGLRDVLLAKKIRGNRVFEDVVVDVEDTPKDDNSIKVLTKKDPKDGWPVGKFSKKADAEKYAAEVHNVELDKRISLKELNAQTAKLHNRAQAGASPEELVADLRNAFLKGEDKVDIKDDKKTPKKAAPKKDTKAKGVTIKPKQETSDPKTSDDTNEESVVV